MLTSPPPPQPGKILPVDSPHHQFFTHSLNNNFQFLRLFGKPWPVKHVVLQLHSEFNYKNQSSLLCKVYKIEYMNLWLCDIENCTTVSPRLSGFLEFFNLSLTTQTFAAINLLTENQQENSTLEIRVYLKNPKYFHFSTSRHV